MMRDEYDFRQAKSNLFAAQIAEQGLSISAELADGRISSRHFPPGTLPSSAKPVHVYLQDKTWVVRIEGATRAFRRLKTEQQATELGSKLARKSGAELVVHFSGIGRLPKISKAA